jgi:hypothetical protein
MILVQNVSLTLGSIAINFLMILVQNVPFTSWFPCNQFFHDSMLAVPFTSWFPKFIIVYWNRMANFVLGTAVTMSVDNQPKFIIVYWNVMANFVLGTAVTLSVDNQVFYDSSANCPFYLLIPLQSGF